MIKKEKEAARFGPHPTQSNTFGWDVVQPNSIFFFLLLSISSIQYHLLFINNIYFSLKYYRFDLTELSCLILFYYL
jgi:hypothetical protein